MATGDKLVTLDVLKAVHDADGISDLQSAINTKVTEPSTDGTDGQVLATDGDGGRYWKTVSGGGGGTSDYTDLSNKPQINSVTLSGNKSLSDLGIHSIPSGGSSSQVLAKASGTDYDVEWVNQSGGGSSEIEEKVNAAIGQISNFNLIDESAVIPDAYYNSSGQLTSSSSGWHTTGAMPIKQGTTVYFSIEENGTRSSAGMYFVILFSENGSTVLDYQTGSLTSYTALYDGLLHFSWKPGTTKTKPFCGVISVADYYDEYGFTYAANQAKAIKPYLGVIWACVGDSMTEKNSTAQTHYFDYISDELGFVTLNYGVGGTGYAAGHDTSIAFYQRIPNIADPFDVLTIFGSVNDLVAIGTGSGQMSLGTYEDTGTTTIGGCINTTLDAFYTLAPTKKLGIISQPPTLGGANNGHLTGTIGQQYNDLLKQICANRGIPFLDLYNCSGLRPWDSTFKAEFYGENGGTADGIHPNSKGQKFISTKIREFIKTVV